MTDQERKPIETKEFILPIDIKKGKGGVIVPKGAKVTLRVDQIEVIKDAAKNAPITVDDAAMTEKAQ